MTEIREVMTELGGMGVGVPPRQNCLRTLMKAEKQCTGGLMVLGFYHSHPDHPARPSEYDRVHAWPFYSYVIVAIHKREPKDMTCWLLDEQTEQFQPQAIS